MILVSYQKKKSQKGVHYLTGFLIVVENKMRPLMNSYLKQHRFFIKCFQALINI